MLLGALLTFLPPAYAVPTGIYFGIRDGCNDVSAPMRVMDLANFVGQPVTYHTLTLGTCEAVVSSCFALAQDPSSGESYFGSAVSSGCPTPPGSSVFKFASPAACLAKFYEAGTLSTQQEWYEMFVSPGIGDPLFGFSDGVGGCLPSASLLNCQSNLGASAQFQVRRPT